MAGRGIGIGSSPLARGLLKNYASLISVFRIIPARAGFTSQSGRCSHPDQDHPRSRGVYAIENSERTYKEGSSPLARGLLGALVGESVGLRIIPARAGFTPLTQREEKEREDHPRSRGVYLARPAGYSSM